MRGPVLEIAYLGPRAPGGRAVSGVRELLDVIEAAAAQEVHYGRALIGPHRDDVELRLGGRTVGKFASAGERRSVALVLELAQTQLLRESTRAEPILLIDDVDAELDDERLERLLCIARGLGQTLVTTSKAGVAERYAAWGTVHHVRAGKIAASTGCSA